MDYATHLRSYIRIFLICALMLLCGGVWFAVWKESAQGVLTVAFLNIGQGDAIYIESPTHNQIIIDGGPNAKILSELSKVMPFYDRSIDALVVTNPDKDHYAGFIDVLARYKIQNVFEPGTTPDTDGYKVLEGAIDEEKAQEFLARRGMIVHLGGGADLHILFPDRDVSGLSTNDGSMIAKLVYGSTSVMFTGDAPSSTEEYVLSLNPSSVKSTLLKVGHHGSRTSASESFVSAVNPDYAIISAGKDNRYGHPHKETTDLLSKLSIPSLLTYEEGTIIMHSDGNSFTRQ